MPRAQTKRYEEIYAQSIARVVARSTLSDVSDVSGWKHVIGASARQDDEQYHQHSLIRQLFSIDTAKDDDLDERAKEIQPGTITRIKASKALGTVVFSRDGTSGSLNIGIGTKVQTADGVVFTTTETGVITPTSAEQITGHGVGRDSNEVSVIADEAGSAGLVDANTVVSFSTKPAGISEVTNPNSFTSGGLDKETDSAFVARIQRYVSGLARCHVSGIENGVVGQVDPGTGSTILYAKAIQDIVNRGDVTLYVDDGSGSAETTSEEATALSGTLTWAGTTSINVTTTADLSVGDWIRLDSDGQWFEVSVITPGSPNVITILNPGSDTIPSGATQSSKVIDVVTEGLSPSDEAVGGETRLTLDYPAIKNVLPYQVATDVQGNLTAGADYTLDPASGLIVFSTALVAGEKVVASYTRYTGLLAFAQKVVDGDPTDRTTYPGYRGAGVLVQVLPPQVLLQNVTAVLTVIEGYSQAVVQATATRVVRDYINSLGISDDLLRAQLFKVIMSVEGVADVDIITPTENVIILDSQLVRTRDANLDIS
jgi:uncharacterized phage protein gp47/JayE